MRPNVSMLVVGDELLDGYIDEANAAWTSRRLRERGIALDRVTIVRDDIEAIRAEVARWQHGPRPSILLTSGGIGGTWDDVTYLAVAEALGVEVHLVEGLARPVRDIIRWAADQGYTFDEDSVDGMLRIATIPEGATVHPLRTYLACVRYAIDGGATVADGAEVVMLPGPPGHFQALMEELVMPDLLPDLGNHPTVVEVTHDYPETLLVGPVRRVRQRYPEVTVGSYPGQPMLLRFQGPRGPAAAAAAQLEEDIDRLDRHPAAEALRAAWQQQAAAWDPGGAS